MRILSVNHTATVGGAEVALLEQVSRDSILPGIEIIIACPSGDLGQQALERGIQTVPISDFEFSLKLHPRALPRQLQKLAESAVEIRKLTASLNVDLIHANSLRSGLMAGAATSFGGVPVVTHIHDCLPPTPLANVVRRVLLTTSTALVANSQHTAANFKGDIKGAKEIDVVYNTFSQDWLKAPSESELEDLRMRLGLEPDNLVVGMVAQLSPWKGQDMAIRAFAHVAKDIPNAKLILAGSAKFRRPDARFDNTAYEQSLHELVTARGLTEKVVFTGEIGRVDLIDRLFDVLLMPSWEEPFGRAAVEAMAVGIAVISTRVGGPPEFIDDGVTGLLLDPKDEGGWARAIRALLGDAERRAELGNRAHGSVRGRFFGDAKHTQLLPVFRSVLAEGGHVGQVRPNGAAL